MTTSTIASPYSIVENLLSGKPYQTQTARNLQGEKERKAESERSCAPILSLNGMSEAKIFVDFTRENLALAEQLISLIKMEKNIISRSRFDLDKIAEVSKDFEIQLKISDIVFVVFDDHAPLNWLIAQLLYCSYITHSRSYPLTTIIYTGTHKLSLGVSSELSKHGFQRVLILSEQELRQLIDHN